MRPQRYLSDVLPEERSSYLDKLGYPLKKLNSGLG